MVMKAADNGARGLRGRPRPEVCIFTREPRGQGRDGDLLGGGNEGAGPVL